MFSDVLCVDMKYKQSVGRVLINEKASLFEEHFSQNPILPGSFSLMAAFELIRLFLSHTSDTTYKLTKIIKVDFISPIKPKTKLMIVIGKILHSHTNVTVYFNLHNEVLRVFLKGIIVLEIEG